MGKMFFFNNEIGVFSDIKKYRIYSNTAPHTCATSLILMHQSFQARIQEFSSGGPSFRKSLTRKKKKKKCEGGNGHHDFNILPKKIVKI